MGLAPRSFAAAGRRCPRAPEAIRQETGARRVMTVVWVSTK